MLGRMTHLRLALALCLTLGFAPWSTPVRAATFDAGLPLWLAPADDVTQHGRDIHRLLGSFEDWPKAAGRARVVSLAMGYLLRTPPDVLQRELATLKSRGLRLDVSTLAVGVDKKVCGNGIEGMIWPGEAGANARRLRELGVEVASFSLDLPLSDGHLMTRRQRPQACELSIHDTAVTTARSVAELHAVYPDATIYDSEVPTGIPVALWASSLEEWLREYRAAAGRDFDGVTMDAWWKNPAWPESVRATVEILARHRIAAGIFLDESGGNDLPGSAWLAATRQHACTLRDLGIRLDYAVVADWSNMNVATVPESDPDTLTGLLGWVAAGARCP